MKNFDLVTQILTQFENESEKYYKNPNNFQYELVKTGTFPCILGILDAKKCPNPFMNISRHLQPKNYSTKQLFLYCNFTQYQMESHQFCNRNHDENLFLHIYLEKVTLFCISIFIIKLINQKTQNNFCSSQIIVPSPPCLIKSGFHKPPLPPKI